MSHLIEDDSGTVLHARHPHNGYYAGDFSGLPLERPDLRHLPTYLPTYLPAQNRRTA